MKLLDLQQTADYLELSSIDHTIDMGHAIIHTGKNVGGVDFVLVNNTNGKAVITEGI